MEILQYVFAYKVKWKSCFMCLLIKLLKQKVDQFYTHMGIQTDILQYILSLLHTVCRSLANVRVSKTKYVVWTQDMNHVAILGKHSKLLKCGLIYTAFYIPYFEP